MKAHAMEAALEDLAKRDPKRAMGLALATDNLKLRAQLRNAVLKGWASVSPQEAGDWAMGLSQNDRVGAMQAVFAGAVVLPADASRLCARLSLQDPERAADYGGALIESLSESGAYGASVQYAVDSPAAPLRLEQINTAFSRWAQDQPSQALAAANAVGDPDAKAQALRGVSTGWAMSDPVGLAEYAATMPAGDLRDQALANALPQWVAEDPTAALAWIESHETNPGFDMGYEALAALPDLVVKHPADAMTLAEKITDPQLKANTVRTLALRWGENDATAASTYIQGSALFQPEEKTSLIAEIHGQP